MRDIFYVVWQPDSGYTKFRHPSRNAAIQEAKRLALAHRGKEFIVLCSSLSVIVDEVRIEEFGPDDGIPF